jgi:hypothetical protein
VKQLFSVIRCLNDSINCIADGLDDALDAAKAIGFTANIIYERAAEKVRTTYL